MFFNVLIDIWVIDVWLNKANLRFCTGCFYFFQGAPNGAFICQYAVSVLTGVRLTND